MQDNKTYGQILQEHTAKNLLMEDDVRSYTESMTPDIIKQIEGGIEAALVDPSFMGKDFFVEMRIRLHYIGRTPETIVMIRHSAPTPNYKQTVWKYYHKSGTLDYLWCLPDEREYFYLLSQVSVEKKYEGLRKFVKMDASGELLTFVKRLNGDKPDAIIKIEDSK